jgi:hypothetical protein
MYNIFSNFDYIFPTPYRMHTLPYFVDEGQAAASKRRPAATCRHEGVARVKKVLAGPSVLCWPMQC